MSFWDSKTFPQKISSFISKVSSKVKASDHSVSGAPSKQGNWIINVPKKQQTKDYPLMEL